MEQATLRKLQLLQLQELKDVTAFCDRHGIRYFLDSGLPGLHAQIREENSSIFLLSCFDL